MHVLVAAVLLALVAQDKPTDKPADKPAVEKARGQLPQGWKQLGLTDQQKQEVYKIQTDYRKKRAGLEQQLKALKDEERKTLAGVLTEAQKKRLAEIRAGGTGGTSNDK